MLYILHTSEDGLHCDALKKEDFDRWLKERTEGVSPEYHPKFLSSPPNNRTASNWFFVIEGEVTVPIPVEIVRTYTLP